MITTLNDIEPHLPADKYQLLLTSLSKTEGDDVDLDIRYILTEIGAKCAMRLLKLFPWSNHGKLLVRLCLDILPLYENDNASQAPRDAIDAMRRRAIGEITPAQLQTFADLALEPAQNASTEQSSTAAWAIYFAAKKDIADAIDGITACRTTNDIQEGDIPNQSDDRAWQEITNRLTDRLDGVEL